MAKRITVDNTPTEAPKPKKDDPKLAGPVEVKADKTYTQAELDKIAEGIMAKYEARIKEIEAKVGVTTEAGAEVPVSVETKTRAYKGPWGEEWICEVENIEDRGTGMVWNVTWQGDERRFVNGGKVQLSPAHIDVLRNAVIREQNQIHENSGYYFNKEQAEEHNPGMKYEIISGRPWLIRNRRRFTVMPLEPATSPPNLHGGVSE